jgi:hypothetical protein
MNARYTLQLSLSPVMVYHVQRVLQISLLILTSNNTRRHFYV